MRSIWADLFLTLHSWNHDENRIFAEIGAFVVFAVAPDTVFVATFTFFSFLVLFIQYEHLLYLVQFFFIRDCRHLVLMRIFICTRKPVWLTLSHLVCLDLFCRQDQVFV